MPFSRSITQPEVESLGIPTEFDGLPAWSLSRSRNAEIRLYERYFIPEATRAYHYTSQGAFSGILGNFSFWCTDVRFLNDRSEVDHAFNMLLDLLNIKREEHGNAALQRDVINSILQALDTPERAARYILCFSQKPDDLNHYRAYASPGAGYCIGFDVVDLSLLARTHGGTIGKCLYGAREQELVLSELLDDCLRELDDYFPGREPGDINEDLVSARTKAFVRSFSRLAPLFKHHAFKEEDEIRLVFDRPTSEGAIKFRCGEIAMVPYRIVPLTLSDSRKVVPSIIYIKGSSESNLSRIGAEEFVLSLGMNVAILEDSRLPYREKI